MKKLLVALLAVVLCLGMAACGEDEGSGSSQSSQQSSAVQGDSSSSEDSSSGESSDQSDATDLMQVSVDEFRTAFNSQTDGTPIGDWYTSQLSDETGYVADLGEGITIAAFEDNAAGKMSSVMCSADLSDSSMSSDLFVNSMVATVMSACPGSDELDVIDVLDGIKLTGEETDVWDGTDHTEIFVNNGYVFSLTLDGYDWSFLVMTDA